jgi:glutaminase
MLNEKNVENATGLINGMVGCSPSWREWSIADIEKLFFYICEKEKWEEEWIIKKVGMNPAS